MKKLGIAILLLVSCVIFTSLVFAQDSEKTKAPLKGMAKEGKMPPMMGMMKNLVATNDGGVVVLIGNRLYKYDKNLNLVKEAEIKVDMRGMQNMMECPMISGENKEKPQKTISPEGKSGHENH